MTLGRANIFVVTNYLLLSVFFSSHSHLLSLADVPCKLSEWSDWSSCSAPCGGGKQTRWKDVIQQPVGVSQSCPIRDETRPCNTDPCGVKISMVLSLILIYSPIEHYFRRPL